MITVSCVTDDVRVGTQLKDVVTRQIQKAARALDLSSADVTILFTGHTRIRMLNKQFRDNNKPTDVLSFAMREAETFPPIPGADSEYLGHIVINMDDVRVRSKKLHTTQSKLAAFLALHAFLHLIGYDHEHEKDEAVMRALERSLTNDNTYYDHH